MGESIVDRTARSLKRLGAVALPRTPAARRSSRAAALLRRRQLAVPILANRAPPAVARPLRRGWRCGRRRRSWPGRRRKLQHGHQAGGHRGGELSRPGRRLPSAPGRLRRLYRSRATLPGLARASAATAPITSPTLTVAPTLARCSASAPATGDGNCTVILSVSSSAIGSSIATASPTFLSQRAHDCASEIDSPSCGTNLARPCGHVGADRMRPSGSAAPRSRGPCAIRSPGSHSRRGRPPPAPPSTAAAPRAAASRTSLRPCSWARLGPRTPRAAPCTPRSTPRPRFGHHGYSFSSRTIATSSAVRRVRSSTRS